MTKTNEELRKLIDEIIKMFPAIKEAVDEASDWDSVQEVLRNIDLLFTVLKKVCLSLLIIKENGKEVFSDEDIINELSNKLDEIIKLPTWAEPFDSYVFKILLTLAFKEAQKLISRIKNKDNTDKELTDAFAIERTIRESDLIC